MKQITWNKQRGLTLTELLAVLLILSLLATIAVPVYVSRQEDARIRVALTECRQYAMAQETVAAMHGFYVPLQLLDELPPRNDGSTPLDEERIDLHYNPNNMYLIIPTVEARVQEGDQFTLGDYNTNALVRKLIDNWSGPFVNFQRFWWDVTSTVYDSPTDDDYRDSDDLFRDFPLDPWGNPYRFYSPIGIIGDGNDHDSNFDFENPNNRFSNGYITQFDDERFQKYAIVSYGRDGIRDTDTLLPANSVPNDIYYEFGTDGVSRNFGKF